MNEQQALHAPVMLTEAVESLNIQPNSWYIDGTFGRGGHTKAILEKGGNVIALDHDQEAIQYGQIHFVKEVESKRLILLRTNFDAMKNTIALSKEVPEEAKKEIKGILFDFGTSVDQLTNQERGFSFFGDGPLDMRMDDRLGVTAAQLLAVLSEQQLSDVFREFGGEEAAKAIARSIVQERKTNPIQTTQQLVNIVAKSKRKRDKLHPATKVFQALRIVVNSELDNIKAALPQALSLISLNGVIVTIAFHEGEDRIVKHTFREWEQAGLVENEDLQKPSIQEINENPRSRSAKLRVCKKIRTK